MQAINWRRQDISGTKLLSKLLSDKHSAINSINESSHARFQTGVYELTSMHQNLIDNGIIRKNTLLILKERHCMSISEMKNINTKLAKINFSLQRVVEWFLLLPIGRILNYG